MHKKLRRGCRTVFDTLFHALVRYAAPVLCFTAEEVWQDRFPSEDGSVHLLEWPQMPDLPFGEVLLAAWSSVRRLRTDVTEAIEPLRREKIIRSSLEAEVVVPRHMLDTEMFTEADLTELFIVAKVTTGEAISVARTDFHKCGRCWRHLPEVVEDGDLCDRCAGVVA